MALSHPDDIESWLSALVNGIKFYGKEIPESDIQA